MKIYTRKGDKGLTSLLGGTRVPKHHIRIDAYGNIDELNASVGFLKDSGISQDVSETLLIIQDRLFILGSILAADPGKSKFALPEILNQDVLFLENKIDQMNEVLPELTSFILPGGHPCVSAAHIARTICRRAERSISLLASKDHVPAILITYINRLSDYLFILARYIGFNMRISEINWKPRK